MLARPQYSLLRTLQFKSNKKALRILSSFYPASQGSLRPAFLHLIYHPCPLFQPHLYALPICILHSSQTDHVLVPLISLPCRPYTLYFICRTTLIHFQVSTWPSLSLRKAPLSTLTEWGALLPVYSYNLL